MPPLSAKKKGKKNLISKALQIEINSLIAIKVLDVAYKSATTKKEDLQKVIYDLFHGKKGDPRSISHLSLFLDGQEPYNNCWVVDESIGGEKVFDPKYHRLGKKFVLGKEIDRSVLEVKNFKNTKLIEGRASKISKGSKNKEFNWRCSSTCSIF